MAKVPALGGKDAPLHLEYFISPYCGPSRTSLEQLFPKLKTALLDSGKADLSLYLIPISDSAEEDGILRGTACAGESRLGFVTYLKIAAAKAEAEENLDPLEVAAEAGLSIARFKRCMASERPAQVLELSAERFRANHLTGVPSICSQGKQLHPMSFESFMHGLSSLPADSLKE